MTPENFPMGTIIAERRLVLYEHTGEKRTITVSLGAPVKAHFPGIRQVEGDESGPRLQLYRCPLQIDGLDHDDKIFPIAGGDPFVALQYAIDFIGELLKGGSERLGLENRARFDSSTRDSWVWRFPRTTEKS
ncbi:MAG TPA: hypothetical protein VHX20_02795 [Terracidiphilus sp.]|jgi:hypothetical protein|nr:hypothetical protein [Terracidiphilus sp.]